MQRKGRGREESRRGEESGRSQESRRSQKAEEAKKAETVKKEQQSGGATLTASTGSIAKDNEKGTTITKAGSVATGDTTRSAS